MVRTPLTEIQTVDQMQKSRQDHKTPVSGIPPEIATQIVHGMLDKQYRMALDEPIGMIGDVSPRQAVATEAGRKKVADWLKFLENRSAAMQALAIRWRPTISHGCGANSGLKNCAAEGLHEKELRSASAGRRMTVVQSGIGARLRIWWYNATACLALVQGVVCGTRQALLFIMSFRV